MFKRFRHAYAHDADYQKQNMNNNNTIIIAQRQWVNNIIELMLYTQHNRHEIYFQLSNTLESSHGNNSVIVTVITSSRL